jgi:hypothetical protein
MKIFIKDGAVETIRNKVGALVWLSKEGPSGLKLAGFTASTAEGGAPDEDIGL